MKKNSIKILILILFYFPVFGQIKNDLTIDKLLGKVKSANYYEIKYGTNPETIFIKKNCYNENGMKLKYINFSEHSRFDSIVNVYDSKNRKTSKIEYKRTGSSGKIDLEKIIDTVFYEYNNCNEPKTIKTPKGDYKFTNKFDEKCNIIAETVQNNDEPKSTFFEFDKKERLIKKTLPEIVETFDYNDQNNTLTFIQYSPKLKVYYIKEVTHFNNKKRVILETTYQQVKLNNGISLATDSKNIPIDIQEKVLYNYNEQDKLISQIYLDGKNIKQLKVEYFYDENGNLKEEKCNKFEKFSYRKEYKYESNNKVEEKIFLPNQKKPEYQYLFKYNAKNLLIESKQLVDGDEYLTEYFYDNFDNKIEQRKLENRKLIETKFTKIEYFKD